MVSLIFRYDSIYLTDCMSEWVSNPIFNWRKRKFPCHPCHSDHPYNVGLGFWHYASCILHYVWRMHFGVVLALCTLWISGCFWHYADVMSSFTKLPPPARLLWLGYHASPIQPTPRLSQQLIWIKNDRRNSRGTLRQKNIIEYHRTS